MVTVSTARPRITQQYPCGQFAINGSASEPQAESVLLNEHPSLAEVNNLSFALFNEPRQRNLLIAALRVTPKSLYRSFLANRVVEESTQGIETLEKDLIDIAESTLDKDLRLASRLGEATKNLVTSLRQIGSKIECVYRGQLELGEGDQGYIIPKSIQGNRNKYSYPEFVEIKGEDIKAAHTVKDSLVQIAGGLFQAKALDHINPRINRAIAQIHEFLQLSEKNRH